MPQFEHEKEVIVYYRHHHHLNFPFRFTQNLHSYAELLRAKQTHQSVVGISFAEWAL